MTSLDKKRPLTASASSHWMIELETDFIFVCFEPDWPAPFASDYHIDITIGIQVHGAQIHPGADS